jgi:hypothetical protein
MINFYKYLDQQSAEDKRAFIVHYPAISGKTAFAKRAKAQRAGIYYLDLQETFLKQPGFPKITQCGFDFLKDYLLGLQVTEEFILIDNPDFLFNTWEAEEKQALLHWIKVQLRSPGVTNKTFIFFIQSDEILATAQFNNSCGQPRILPLDEFEAI